jgi:uncharacterized membrane protein (DUF2068 family)
MTTASTISARPARSTGRSIVILIGLFKLGKAFLLILAAALAVALTRNMFSEGLRTWINVLQVGPFRQRIGDFILDRVLGLTNKKTLYTVALGCGLYATLFATEGIGLLLDKIWAEWLAVISTAGLLPLEVIEIVKRHDDWRAMTFGVAVFAANVAIVIYLFIRVRARVRQHKLEHGSSNPR